MYVPARDHVVMGMCLALLCLLSQDPGAASVGLLAHGWRPEELEGGEAHAMLE